METQIEESRFSSSSCSSPVKSTADGSKVSKLTRIFAKYPRKRQLESQEASKATPRAQLMKYLNEVATITVPSNVFELGNGEEMNFLLFLNYPSTHYVCISASSTPVEKMFSTSRLIMRLQRARLSAEM